MKLPFIIQRAAQKFAGEPALVYGNRIITYAEFRKQIMQTAGFFKKNGLLPEERVAIYGEPSPQYVFALFALMSINAIAVPLSRRLPSGILNEQLELTGSSVLLSDDWPGNRPPKLKHYRLPDSTAVNGEALALPDQINEDQPVTILFTSGSSGQARAVVHNYGNHYYNALGSNENIKLSPGNRWLLSLPLYHVSGMSLFFRAALAGAAVVMADNKKSLAAQILECRPSHISLVPTQMAELLGMEETRRYISRMQAVLVGGSAIPQKLIRRAYESGWPLFVSYGSTQMASQIATTRPQVDSDELYTSGHVLSHRQVRIAENGEILVKGRTLFPGYWRDGKIISQTDSEGWFASGDVGYFDEQGRLIVQGRLDRMFISGGENIYPEEIENELLKIEGVSRAVVVAQQDARFGQRPVAFIEVNYFNDSVVEKIIKQLREQLPAFKVPDRFLPWPEDAPQGMKTPWKWFEKAIKN